MARILTISSQVVFGPVGNTAAVPPMQAEGHDVMQVPTIILSHHPGHGKPAAQPISAEAIENLLASIANTGALESLDAIMTGYFANAEQIEIVSELMKNISRSTHVLVDPVLGDHGQLYVAEPTAAAIRDLLIPHATIATPNAFELAWLTGSNTDSQTSAETVARSLGPSEVIATSVMSATDQLTTLHVSQHGTLVHHTPRRSHVPHGTGDFLAGCYLAQRLKHDATRSFAAAMQNLEHAISRSGGDVLIVT